MQKSAKSLAIKIFFSILSIIKSGNKEIPSPYDRNNCFVLFYFFFIFIMAILGMVKKEGGTNAYYYYTPYAIYDARYANDGKSIEVYKGGGQWVLFRNNKNAGTFQQNKTGKTTNEIRS